MSLRVWIGREFETQHEREQVTEIVRLMRESFDQTAEEINLLCNFEFGDAPIDLAVMKSDALIIVDLKTASGVVSGGVNGTWVFTDSSGALVDMNKGRGRNKNPFIQMRNYRHSTISYLQKHATSFMDNRQLSCVKCVDRYVKCTVLLYPSLLRGKDKVEVEGTYKLWFSVCRPGTFCQFVQSQTSSFDFETRQLKKLIEKQLNLKQAVLVGNAPAVPGQCEPLIEIAQEEDIPPLTPIMPYTIPAKPKELTDVKRTDSVVDDMKTTEAIDASVENRKTSVPENADSRPVIDSSDVRYISIGVRGALEAKGLKGDVTDIYFEQNPDYDIGGNWGALCVYKYEDSGKSIEDVKRELDYYLEDEQPSYIVGDRIVWPFPPDASLGEDGPSNVKENVPMPRMLTVTVPTLPPLKKELSHHAVLPRALDYMLYRVEGLQCLKDLRNGDEREQGITENADRMKGCYFPISFAETYNIFDAFFERSWEMVYGSRENLSVSVKEGFAGGSLCGFLFALRRYSSSVLKKVRVSLIGADNEYRDLCVRLMETLSESGTFSFSLDIVEDDLGKEDFLILNGRRDGGALQAVDEVEMSSFMRRAPSDAVLFASDITGIYFSGVFGRIVDRLVQAAEGWHDLTAVINGRGAQEINQLFPQQFACQVLSRSTQLSRTIVYRIVGRGAPVKVYSA